MPILRLISHAAAASGLMLSVAVAQRPEACEPARIAADSALLRSMELVGSLVPTDSSADVAPMYLATLLQEIQRVLHAPDTMAELSAGQMSVWLHADGRLTNPRPIDRLPPPLVRTLTNAIDSVSRLGGIGPVFPSLRSDSVPVSLVLYISSQRTPFSIPLLRFNLPVYYEFQVEKPAMAKPSGRGPRYPEVLRENNIEGEVLAQFVVDRSGQPEMRTLTILKSSHVEFTIAVRDFIPRMSFFPAEVGGCVVRQLVQLPFAFKLNR
jgi:TonB family protein